MRDTYQLKNAFYIKILYIFFTYVSKQQSTTIYDLFMNLLLEAQALCNDCDRNHSNTR